MLERNCPYQEVNCTPNSSTFLSVHYSGCNSYAGFLFRNLSYSTFGLDCGEFTPIQILLDRGLGRVVLKVTGAVRMNSRSFFIIKIEPQFQWVKEQPKSCSVAQLFIYMMKF